MKRKTVFGNFCRIFILLLLFSACGQEEKSTQKTLPPSKGVPYELLLVVDKTVWNSPVGDSLQAVFKGSVPGLPQHEPLFKLIRIYTENYVPMYTTMRNILFVSLDSTLQKPRLSLAYHVKAQPQVVQSLQAPTLQGVEHILMKRKQEIVDVFVESELALEAKRLEKQYHRDTEQAAQKIFGYRICVPDEMRSMKQREQFLWSTTDQNEKDLNLVLYTFPFDSKADFADVNYWVGKRDSVMKTNIPGGWPDQWMTTTREDDRPLVDFRQRVLHNRQTWEIRGLWEMRHGAIGGPFVALARIDTVQKKVIVSEGFVYSPRTEKRNLMRRMEAALRTLAPVKH